MGSRRAACMRKPRPELPPRSADRAKAPPARVQSPIANHASPASRSASAHTGRSSIARPGSRRAIRRRSSARGIARPSAPNAAARSSSNSTKRRRCASCRASRRSSSTSARSSVTLRQAARSAAASARSTDAPGAALVDGIDGTPERGVPMFQGAAVHAPPAAHRESAARIRRRSLSERTAFILLDDDVVAAGRPRFNAHDAQVRARLVDAHAVGQSVA